MMRHSYRLALLTLGVGVLAWACTRAPQATTAAPSTAKVARAVAVLHPTEGNDVKGTVHFTQQENGILVSVRVEGLKPGLHGFHVHEFGDCTSPDGSSAGGHFNPFDAPHGGRDSAQRHVGDLGNITANDQGVAEVDFTDSRIAFEGAASIIGRGLIVHAGEDDLKTQPSGAAGARVACGVIGVAR